MPLIKGKNPQKNFLWGFSRPLEEFYLTENVFVETLVTLVILHSFRVTRLYDLSVNEL